MKYLVRVAATTHRGRVREVNEDSFAITNWIRDGEAHSQLEPTPMMALIADGMGGHSRGEVASRLVAHQLRQELAHSELLSNDDVADALRSCNRAVFDASRQSSETHGMGSTVVGVIVTDDKVLVFNVGDSRCYRFRDGYLTQLSIDDTADPPSYGDHSPSEKSGRITQALGGAETYMDIEPHLKELQPALGLILLLCSDGLTDMLSPDQIEASLHDDLAVSVATLQNAALGAGGYDNISIILLRLESEITPAPSRLHDPK